MTERENDFLFVTWEYFHEAEYFSTRYVYWQNILLYRKKGPQKSTYWWALSYLPGDIKLAATQEHSLDDHLV